MNLWGDYRPHFAATKRGLIALAGAAVLALPAAATAATTQTLGPATINVSVNVVDGCTWDAPSGTQTFSSYDPSKTTATTSDNTQAMDVTCNTGAPYSFSISGISWSGSASSNPSIVETIYNANSSGSIGSPPTTPSSPTGNSVNQYYAIQGSMAAGQWGLSSGSYSGTFTVTLSYS